MTSAMLRLGVALDLATPMPFSGCSLPSLCRLSNVVILASRLRLPTCDPQKFHFQSELVPDDLPTLANDVKGLHAATR